MALKVREKANRGCCHGIQVKRVLEKKGDVVRYTECRSSKIKTNNLYSQFSTMVNISYLDKNSFN